MSRNFNTKRKKFRRKDTPRPVATRPSSIQPTATKDITKRLEKFFRELQADGLDVNQVTDDQISIVMLSQKAIDHCRAGLLLLPFASLDAAILLRAAYEATVVAQYLTRNPDQLDEFHLYADLIKLRNQHEALAFAEDEDTRAEQQSYINKVQAEVLARYAEKNRQAPSYLGDIEKLRLKTEKPHFKSLHEMRTDLKNDHDGTGAFADKVALQTYNVGSQIAHSSRDVMLSHYFYRSEQPLYSLHSLYRQIIYLVNGNVVLLANRGVIQRMERHEQLFTILKVLLENAPGGPVTD